MKQVSMASGRIEGKLIFLLPCDFKLKALAQHGGGQPGIYPSLSEVVSLVLLPCSLHHLPRALQPELEKIGWNCI
jgi:hypothetical protein